MNYKFRAECYDDVKHFFKALPDGELVSSKVFPDTDGLPDVEVAIEVKSLTLNEIRQILHDIPDSHVMLQTVA